MNYLVPVVILLVVWSAIAAVRRFVVRLVVMGTLSYRLRRLVGEAHIGRSGLLRGQIYSSPFDAAI